MWSAAVTSVLDKFAASHCLFTRLFLFTPVYPSCVRVHVYMCVCMCARSRPCVFSFLSVCVCLCSGGREVRAGGAGRCHDDVPRVAGPGSAGQLHRLHLHAQPRDLPVRGAAPARAGLPGPHPDVERADLTPALAAQGQRSPALAHHQRQ